MRRLVAAWSEPLRQVVVVRDAAGLEVEYSGEALRRFVRIDPDFVLKLERLQQAGRRLDDPGD